MIINTIIHDYMKNVSLTRPFLPLVALNITIIYSNSYCKITEAFCFSIFTVILLLFYSARCCTFFGQQLVLYIYSKICCKSTVTFYSVGEYSISCLLIALTYSVGSHIRIITLGYQTSSYRYV